MWVVGDWGQSSPWSRDTGVKMVKGENNVYTGNLSLPKGTKFDIKILKSTVSTTSGGDNTWSAVRYASTLNMSTSHGFGEFTDNLVPNGNFEEGPVKWTPAECISKDSSVYDGHNILIAGGPKHPTSCASDVIVLPPNQTLSLTGYVKTWLSDIEGAVSMKVVTPQQQTLFEFSVSGTPDLRYKQFSKTFKTDDVPMECQIVLSNENIGTDWKNGVFFDSLSLVSP